jgi:hypothetical protein
MSEEKVAELNRVSFICPEDGKMISAPAGALAMVTYAKIPGGHLIVSCPCGKDHRLRTKRPHIV